MSDLFRNPEDRFSRVAAHIKYMSNHREKYITYLKGVQVASALSHALDHAHKFNNGTCIVKKTIGQENEVENKTQVTLHGSPE